MEKIILFDAYGTLFRIDTANTQLDSILGEEKSEFLELWRSKLLEYSWLTSLMENWEGFNSIIDKAIRYSCRVYNIDFPNVQPILKEIYEHPLLFPDAPELLRKLSQAEYHNCIISNGEPETLLNAVRDNGIENLIDQIFSASVVKKFKVSPKVYRMATAFFNIGPGNIYFVSSNAWDISGAKHFGYKTIWVNRDKKKFDCLVEEPDHMVSSLSDIESIVL